MDAHEKYNFAVNCKIDKLKDHPKYNELRKRTDKDLIMRTGFGLNPISSDTRTNMFILRSENEIRSWLNGECDLEFTTDEIENMDKRVREAYEKTYAERFAE